MLLHSFVFMLICVLIPSVFVPFQLTYLYRLVVAHWHAHLSLYPSLPVSLSLNNQIWTRKLQTLWLLSDDILRVHAHAGNWFSTPVEGVVPLKIRFQHNNEHGECHYSAIIKFVIFNTTGPDKFNPIPRPLYELEKIRLFRYFCDIWLDECVLPNTFGVPHLCNLSVPLFLPVSASCICAPCHATVIWKGFCRVVSRSCGDKFM